MGPWTRRHCRTGATSRKAQEFFARRYHFEHLGRLRRFDISGYLVYRRLHRREEFFRWRPVATVSVPKTHLSLRSIGERRLLGTISLARGIPMLVAGCTQ